MLRYLVNRAALTHMLWITIPNWVLSVGESARSLGLPVVASRLTRKKESLGIDVF